MSLDLAVLTAQARADEAAKGVGWCTHCGVRIASWEGLSGCPNCGTTGKPCGANEQLVLSINLHELRILTMWAERWATEIKSPGALHGILTRLHAQIDPLTGAMPLTLTEEIGEVKKQFGADNVKTNIPGIEP